jgi:23S rRNA (guanosine2251-2'-O)-methyltransferase
MPRKIKAKFGLTRPYRSAFHDQELERRTMEPTLCQTSILLRAALRIVIGRQPPERAMPPRSPRPSDTRKPRKPHWLRKGDHRPPPRPPAPRPLTEGEVILYGWHTVKAALENPQRRIRKLYATENAARRLAEDGIALSVTPEIVRPDAIAQRLSADAVHNGLLAEADPLPAPALEELAPEGIVLVLDQITDPHNVGAILRTAAGFAVAAVVTTARHSPEATGVLAKSASGALEYVPIVSVPNLARALEALRERGYLLLGLDSTGDADLADAPLRAPLALVLGAEGKGLRQLTRTTCDVVARLDLPGRIKSLNVSNAAALALYVASKQIGA